MYESAAMRPAYLAQDRPDLHYSRREVARGLQSLLERQWTVLWNTTSGTEVLVSTHWSGGPMLITWVACEHDASIKDLSFVTLVLFVRNVIVISEIWLGRNAACGWTTSFREFTITSNRFSTR